MSRFIINNASVLSVEPRQGPNSQYWLIHFNMNVEGKTGSYPKATSIACFDPTLAQSVVVGQVYDMNGAIGVNKQGYLNFNLKAATNLAMGAAPQAAAGVQQQAQPMQVPQQAPQQAVPPQQYGTMPAAPPQPAAPAANNFDDEIPF